jgi:TPR repeat protein
MMIIMKNPVLLFLFMIPFCLNGITVESGCNPKILPVGAIARYSVIVSGSGSVPESGIHTPSDLNMEPDGSTQSFKRKASGEMEIQIAYSFKVSAQKPGVYIIDPYKLKIDGQDLEVASERIEIMSAADYENYSKSMERALKGDAGAQYSLGIIFYYGNGTGRDLIEAFGWFDVAAANNHHDASNILYSMLKTMKPNEIRAGKKRSEQIQKDIKSKANSR